MRLTGRTITIGAYFFCIAAAFTAPAHSQDSSVPDELAAIYACKSKLDNLERLSCYDNAVGNFEAAEKSGQVVTIDKTAIDTVEREAFGFNIPSLPSLGKLFGGGKTNRAETEARIIEEQGTAASTQAKAKPILMAPKDSDVKSVLLTIDRTQKFGYDKIRFYMTNGQVWEQTTGSPIRVPKVRNNTPNTAKISKASLGSFMLKVNGKGRAARVKRVN